MSLFLEDSISLFGRQYPFKSV
uniref:Uncharacterized protein n=1 Tax=Amphimedon queenslandica TaxID=400682 RepID=A0A1X7V7Y0_AMPQE